jgi:hypothetical protein
MFQETVSLILKHSDISTITELSSISNNVGSWSNGKGKTSWRINLRNVLGADMYDNNEMFILRLNQIAYATANFPVASKDQQLIITFGKTTNNVILTIELFRTIDNASPAYGVNRFPHCCYSFDIYPVKKL